MNFVFPHQGIIGNISVTYFDSQNYLTNNAFFILLENFTFTYAVTSKFSVTKIPSH
jgi:hypothetical protein